MTRSAPRFDGCRAGRRRTRNLDGYDWSLLSTKVPAQKLLGQPLAFFRQHDRLRLGYRIDDSPLVVERAHQFPVQPFPHATALVPCERQDRQGCLSELVRVEVVWQVSGWHVDPVLRISVTYVPGCSPSLARRPSLCCVRSDLPLQGRTGEIAASDHYHDSEAASL